ncbi:MAG: hypothetical protein COU11_04070 [Candidatus Harrisonbacteria bacterium CG10_big_fil_rev_8_21_14_0_10_49_15]|uniref:Uncharacterized protein n=1 Tax=Candidatus Harrisonbacteria bacterium CG10_big_fil_rev_8_21_14_0_10_49_15 TaxID=1974587 RepID=A0A2H0UJT4_9BACT|nr:MAG: hypothetical protein COU11_04070 [Candidatus Harrisonbacteria bacterium CG10_big_fil_rev_8_21_14_0_10_49_15]
MSDALAYTAAVGLAVCIISYFCQVLRGDSTPNTTTWLIWSVVMTINSLTYIEVAGSIKALSSLTTNAGIIAIFIYSLLKGKFTKVSRTDVACLALASMVGAVWQITDSAKIATVALQIVFVISFWPTINGLLKRRAREHPLNWDIAVVAYACLIASILLDWQGQHWTAIAFPLVNGIIGNGSVAVLAHLQLRKPPPAPTSPPRVLDTVPPVK